MSSDFSSNALLVADVQRRLVAMLPSQGTFAVLVELGAGATAKQAKADLVAALRGESRIAWSQMTSRPDGPLPDAASPGGHVNAVQYRIEPAPQLVLLVNEREGRLQMAARDPGPDPLGPATDGWLWILIGP